MKTTKDTPLRSRSDVLAALNTIPSAVQGSISSFRVTLAGGDTALYHKLQYWAGGRNHSIHIPEGKLPAFERAVEGGRAAKALMTELTGIDAEAILSPGVSQLKKKSMGSSRRGRRGSGT